MEHYLRSLLFALLLAYQVLFYLHVDAASCQSGWFWDGTQCMVCDSSCKACINATACDTCESYMYYDSTTNKCKFCQDGLYYDNTYQICRSCDGKCTGYCKGQKQCFVCEQTKVLDLETLSCVSNCDVTKYQISSSQYSIGELCRLLQFYVDPLSSEIIELGTISYPYKSMRAVSSDILNNFSHQNVNITIYLKEYESVYMSDLTGYYLNITSIHITSYSTSSNSPGKATLIPTQISLSNTNQRTLFHILTNMDLGLSQTLSKSSFSSSETDVIYNVKATIYSARTNISLSNINIKRELIDSSLVIAFLQLIYLQNKWLDVQNVSFSLSGTAFSSNDPLNIYFYSLIVDTYNLRNFAQIMTSCNYPEAYLTGTLISSNITVYTSATRTLSDDPGIIQYLGPANVTISGLNLERYAVRQTSTASGIAVVSGASCIPNDGNTQLFQLKNNTYSVQTNPFGIMYSSLIVIQDQNFYRISNVTINNFLFVNMINPFHPFCFMIGNYNSEVYIMNSEFRNSSIVDNVIASTAFKNIVIKNCVFNNFTNIQNSMFVSFFCLSVIYDTITFSNMNFDQSYSYELIMLNNMDITNTLISNIYF